MARLWLVSRLAWLVLRCWFRWLWDHKRWVLALGVVAAIASAVGRDGWALSLVLASTVPGLLDVLWFVRWPRGYELWIAGPSRRRLWRVMVHKTWPLLVRECGLSVQRTLTRHRGGIVTPRRQEVEAVWLDPELSRVRTAGNSVHLAARCRLGQTPDDIASAVPEFAAAFGAVSHQVRQISPSEVEIELVMVDGLADGRPALPTADTSDAECVDLGRRDGGEPWMLTLNERHTLVVGCSGSGKGSVLWGVCGRLARAVSEDRVRLYGVDLKAGLEVGMGRGLFTSTAFSHGESIAVMRRLEQVIRERGECMIGIARKHVPTPGDPMHVLVVDELAALISYENDPKARAEATRLLSLLLSQGRALGVIVIAFVQDPSKETVKPRNLFTQTVALRLRSADETRMVLGEGMADRAPAHKIRPDAPGTAWVVRDDGSAERVRADYWSDDLVRELAEQYPAAVVESADVDAPAEAAEPVARARSPRKAAHGGEAA
ncbi:hypothetical protein [Calidifontibacter indicus]|uniref:hypothetical protein n=1 Tax=Calidifontibacter indicus TaxID=419650 RepID=UPI003D702D90